MVLICFIAMVCVMGFLVIWFVMVHKELIQKRQNLKSLKEQLLLHEEASVQVREEMDKEIAERMLETNRMIYCEAVREYNKLLKKTMNRLPALLMKFHSVDESGSVCEK